MQQTETMNLLKQTWLDNLRLNRNQEISKAFFCYAQEINSEMACELFRFQDEIMGWDAYDAFNYRTEEMIAELHLTTAYNQLAWPKDLVLHKEPAYVAVLCYPEKLSEFKNQYTIWQSAYDNILSGKKKMSQKFFDEETGHEKSIFCLASYLCRDIGRFSNIEELYNFFNTPDGFKYIKQKAKLGYPCEVFFNSPLEFVHESLSDSGQKDEFLFMFEEFKNIKKEFNSELFPKSRRFL